MNFRDYNLKTKKRRGLSSIVGALLFVVLMVSTFTVLGTALDSQTEIVDVNRAVADAGLKKQQEDFRIDAYTDNGAPNALLTVDVENLGQNSLEIFSLVVTEDTDLSGTYPSTVYDIPADKSDIAPGKTKNIVSAPTVITLALPTGLELNKVYSFKVISSLGTIETDSILCDQTSCIPAVAAPGEGSLTSTVFLDGPNGVNGKISTVVMFVSNTSDQPIVDVKPALGFTAPLCDGGFWVPDDSGQTENKVDPETITLCNVTPLPAPAPQIDLGPYASTLFKWDGVVNGDIGSTFTFCNSVTGDDGSAPLVTSAQTCDLLTVIDPNDCGGCGPGGESIILIDDLLIKPSIFMVIPSPFGASDKGDDQKGIWGINVANPTDKDMEITKVTIVAYPPGGQSQDNVISGVSSDPCLEEDIQPLTGPVGPGYWDCPRDNILVWDGLSDPVLLAANSTKSFMVKVEPSGIKPGGSPANLDALIVQANVWSTFGSFGKAGYQSTMYLEKTSIVNVYLSDSTTSRSTIVGYQNDLQDMTSHNFKAVLADMDTDPDTVVNIGARLVINIPREWVFDGFNENPIPGFDPPTVTVHSDGSTQIIAETNVPVGDGTNDAIGIDFNAIAPDVEAPRLYVMYILADGTVTVGGAQKTIGPLNEIVLNVDP